MDQNNGGLGGASNRTRTFCDAARFRHDDCERKPSDVQLVETGNSEEKDCRTEQKMSIFARRLHFLITSTNDQRLSTEPCKLSEQERKFGKKTR